ncbi:MAG: hypothetical protein HFH04_00425 [Dorea sp.]|nr:hypothetical protein [Dorea sp.]
MWEINLHKECKKDDLAEYGFRKCGAEYRLNIPLYKYKHTPIISVNFVVSIFDNYIGYDVIDNNSGELYTHLYNRMYSNPKHNKVLKKIIKELNIHLERMKNVGIISDYRKVR